jgi:protoporphyrinogen/coproporphyrinogen III oxidase
MPAKAMRIAVVGAGICGLAAAHRLLELCPEWTVTLLEASGRAGGILSTEFRDGFLIEQSADMFSTREPWALHLCQRLGMERELIGTNEAFRSALVVRQGKLYRIPAGLTVLAPRNLAAVMRSPLLSVRGKLRIVSEYFIRGKLDADDESFAQFAQRRFGKEAFERLLQPLVAGIYTADPDKLSMEACLSEFLQMERNYGGILRAIQAEKKQAKTTSSFESGARYGLFLAPRRGMQQFVDCLAERIGAHRIHYHWPVEEMTSPSHNSWRLRKRGEEEIREFDGVVLAASAKQSASLLSEIARDASQELANIEHAGASIVVAAYRSESIGRKLDSFGFVAPRLENRRVLAGSFSSMKFAGRAPEGHILMRYFMGGALQPHLVDVDDHELIEIVKDDTRDLLRVRGDPIFTQVIRWRGRMPQYHVGHLRRVERIEAAIAKTPRLELASNALRGVGIPYCIRAGELAAERLVDKLKTIGEEFAFPPRKPR